MDADNGWDVAIGVTQDVGRAAGITVLVGGGLKGTIGRGGAAESTTLTRAGYVQEVESLKDLANSARAAGQDAEATARMVSSERNALKIKYRELSPADFVKQAEARNIEKYGNPLGPTVDQLRAQGKTWEQIIDSSARAGGKDLGL
jgi:hypothetical protein